MGRESCSTGNSDTKTARLTLLGKPDTGEPIDRVAEAHSALQLLVKARPQPRSGPVWRIRIQDPSRRHLEIYLGSSLYKFENSFLIFHLWRFIASGSLELPWRK